MGSRHKNTKRVVADIQSIKDIGLETWMTEFYWPMTDDEFYDLTEFVYESYNTLLIELDDIGRDILLSDNQFVVAIIQYLHFKVIETRCKQNGIQMLSGNSAQRMCDPSWEKYPKAIENAISRNLLKAIGKNMKRIIRDASYNRHISFYKRLKGILHADVLGIGSTTYIKKEYTKREGLFLDHTSAELILYGTNLNNGKIDKKQAELIANFLHKVEEYCWNNYRFQFDCEQLQKNWIKRLGYLHAMYNHVRKNIGQPSQLLVNSEAIPFNRIIAHAVEGLGCLTIAFHHGNSMGGLTYPYGAYNSQSSYNIHISPTRKCAESRERIYKKSPISRIRMVDFRWMDTARFRDEFYQFQQQPFPHHIGRVMLLGSPMTVWRYLGVPAQFFAFQLELEIRIVRLLKKHDFEVYYKPHPSSKMVHDLFHDECDRVIDEPFEQVWHMADALIFKYTSSSTFGFSLRTNRPIFWIDYEGDSWDAAHHEQLSKRCEVIPAWADERNLIQYDEQLLLQKLFAKPNPPDFSYIHNYMFPEE